MTSQVYITAETKILGDLLPICLRLGLTDKVKWDTRYPMELFEVGKSWPGHHGYKKKHASQPWDIFKLKTA